MEWLHPGTVLLGVLFLVFLSRGRRRLALGAASFVLLVGLAEAACQGWFGGDSDALRFGFSVTWIAGCVWFTVAAMLPTLRTRDGETTR